MSGGVDSSAAAALLKKDGYDVVGVIMEIFDESITAVEGTRHACFGPGEKEDIADAKKVAEKLAIPLYIIDLKERYRKSIINFFVQEYLEGKTPNPCVKCNHELKFGAVIDELKKRGIDFDYFATGHYARIDHNGLNRRGGQFYLKKAVDRKKDQSYFLYNLSRDQLKSIIFPLGNYKKDEVRALVGEWLPEISKKAESQDFVAGGYRQLFEKAGNPGPILNTRGEKIGEHQGIAFYTIGQRRGIGIPSDLPFYVIARDSQRNAVIVGEKEELLGTQLIAKELNWLTFEKLARTILLQARIRFQHKETTAAVNPLDNGRVLVKFKEPQLAITPGQAVVFYEGDTVVGGGIIEKEVKQ